MIFVAITGSIGCGKTTLAKIVSKMGYTVFDVDGWVRRIYFDRLFLDTLNNVFPGAVREGVADKRYLRNLVFNDQQKLKQLENLIHPFLKENLKNVIRKNAYKNDVFFIDVALLFEMGWDKYCDLVIVADVDYEIQKKRVMKRDNVSSEDFERINNVQMSNKKKKEKADIVIDTNQNEYKFKLEMINVVLGLKGFLYD